MKIKKSLIAITAIAIVAGACAYGSWTSRSYNGVTTAERFATRLTEGSSHVKGKVLSLHASEGWIKLVVEKEDGHTIAMESEVQPVTDPFDHIGETPGYVLFAFDADAYDETPSFTAMLIEDEAVIESLKACFVFGHDSKDGINVLHGTSDKGHGVVGYVYDSRSHMSSIVGRLTAPPTVRSPSLSREQGTALQEKFCLGFGPGDAVFYTGDIPLYQKN